MYVKRFSHFFIVKKKLKNVIFWCEKQEVQTNDVKFVLFTNIKKFIGMILWHNQHTIQMYAKSLFKLFYLEKKTNILKE